MRLKINIFIFHCFIALLFIPVNAQNRFINLSDDMEVPKNLERKFKRDAARLALRMEGPVENLSNSQIAISEKKMESIFLLLKNIYLQNETAKTIAKCKIHTFPDPAIDHFKLIYQNDAEWATSLNEDISETTNEDINVLLDEYDLFIDHHEKWTNEEDVIIIRSLSPMNMAALAKKFTDIEGVSSIDFGIPEIKGNDITMEQQGSSWVFTYYLAATGTFGQEPTNHIWTFKVSPEGQVSLIKEDGPPIPEWLKCDLSIFTTRI